MMLVSSDVNNRSELNESMRESIIVTHDTLCSIIKDEVIIPNDSNFNDFSTKDDDSIYSPNNVGEIKDITINAAGANGESSVEIYDSDAKKTMSNNSTIDHVHSDKKLIEYSQLSFNCDITMNELMHQTELCKATKSFTCSACPFECCSKNKLEYHMQNDHKISNNYAVTSDSKEKEMSKLMNHSSNGRSSRRFSKTDIKKYVEVHCIKCANRLCPTTFHKQQTCGLCNASVIYQCQICKKRYTHPRSLYKHLTKECNTEPQYKCSQCEYKGKRYEHLRDHLQSKHGIKECKKCGDIFKDTFAFRQHQLHKCSALLKCTCCAYKTIFQTNLKDHIRREHNFRYMCSQCGKKYKNLKSFNNHQKTCGFELFFECNHCSYSTTVNTRLERHIRSEHSEIFLFRDLSLKK